MKLVMLLPYLRALYQMYQHMHWKSSGDNYYGDHLLFERLYEDVQEELDAVAEKILGVSDNPELINIDSDSAATAKLLKKILSSDKDYAKQAIAAEQGLLDLIKDIMSKDTTDGMEDMLQGIANKHEEHLYLLQQRNRTAGGNNMLAKLYKLAYHLDQKGLYDEAQAIEEVMSTMAKRVGLNLEDMVSLANYFDDHGEVVLANYFDDMARKTAKYKTHKGKDEKPPKGAEHKAPKKWFDKMKKRNQKQKSRLFCQASFRNSWGYLG